VTAEAVAADALDVLFGALADPTRRQLLQTLLTKGPATATVLAAPLPVSRQAIVKHLQALEVAGLVTPERDGREVRYRATPERLASAVGWLLDAGGSWDRRIDRLRTR
jgi:DNA-binding transcriptional ArsR family regulator